MSAKRWAVSDPVEHPDYVPLDMANNVDDERVRQRVAWIDGLGRAYAHSIKFVEEGDR